MVHPQPDRNHTLHERRETDPREQPGNLSGRLPYPNEVIGGRQEPPFEVTGMDALSPLLLHVDFPATKADIVATIGQARIALDKVTTATVAELIQRTAPERFASSAEVEAALERIMRDAQPHYEDGRGAHHRQGDNLSGRRPN